MNTALNTHLLPLEKLCLIDMSLVKKLVEHPNMMINNHWEKMIWPLNAI